MGITGELSFRATLDEFRRESDAVLAAAKAGQEDALWRFKWMHPRFRGRPITDVDASTLDSSDAQLLVAREYYFENWTALSEFIDRIKQDGAVLRFETAVESVVSGDIATLRSILCDDPTLIRARSMRMHHATLLHYIGANGVEGGRQKAPTNAVEVAKYLLDAGAEVDALADMYDQKCTTMSMLVSSSHPAKAGVQVALANTLLDYGAAFDGPGSAWQSGIMTALTFGYPDAAEALAKRGAPLNDIAAAAGLGRREETARLLAGADGPSKHLALAQAAQHGHGDVVRLLLDAGEDPNRFNPDGHHSHSTPLHQAVLAGHEEVVKLLVERGARLDIKDTLYRGTPLNWAIHGKWTAIADYLRERGESTV